MLENDRVIAQLFYLVILKIDFPLFFTLVIVSLTQMDIIHTFLLIIFVVYTLFPVRVLRHSFTLLVYAELIVLVSYVYSLLQKTEEPPVWA